MITFLLIFTPKTHIEVFFFRRGIFFSFGGFLGVVYFMPTLLMSKKVNLTLCTTIKKLHSHDYIFQKYRSSFCKIQGWGSGRIRRFLACWIRIIYSFHRILPTCNNVYIKLFSSRTKSTNSSLKSNCMPIYLKYIYFLHFELRSDPEPDFSFTWVGSGSEEFYFGSSSIPGKK